MKIDPSAINSPLALIALFVAIIELFLIFPITQLTGWDRSLLVIFIIAYPVFIATAFFVFLWKKPVNLYTPQTLSADLQQALLPDKLLAPDRAAVTAVELKITTLETQIRDVAQRLQSNVGIAVPDVAKLSDLDDLKRELLARAEAAGDISRGGLATAAKEIETEVAEETSARIALAKKQIGKFKIWMEKKGLTAIPITFSLGESSVQTGPRISGKKIILGAPNRDYLMPGTIIHLFGEKKGFSKDYSTGTGELIWVLGDYMSSRFMHLDFPNQNGPIRVTKTDLDIGKIYVSLYDLFVGLSKQFGNDAVEAGVINMINEWNRNSSLRSSFVSMASGMSKVGANLEKASSMFDECRVQIEAIKIND